MNNPLCSKLSMLFISLATLSPSWSWAQTSSAPQDATGPEAPRITVTQALTEPRFRGGFLSGGGPFYPGNIVAFGLSAQLGAQLDHTWAVYGDLGFAGGFSLQAASSTSSSAAGVAYFHLGAMGEVTLVDALFLAFGPQLAFGGWTSAVSTGSGSAMVAAGGVMPTLAVRVGVGFGAPKPTGRRHQFVLAFDAKIFRAPVVRVDSTAGGGSSFTGSSVIGVAPMLVLGYAAK